MVPTKNAKKLFLALSLFISLALLNACNVFAPPAPAATPTETATQTPSPTSTPTLTASPTDPPATVNAADWLAFDSEWLQLSYPPDWTVEEPLGEPVCFPGMTDCIIRLSHSPSESVEIQFFRNSHMNPPGDAAVEEEESWQLRVMGTAIVGAPELLKLISVDEIEVDGIKAIRRLYEYPLVDPATGKLLNIESTYRVFLVLGESTYVFEMKTTSPEEFALYTEVADGIVSTISFHR